METSKFISECIRHRLKTLKIKKQDFACLLGVKPPLVSRYLSGTHNFTVETLEKIQTVLSVKFFSYEEVGMPLCRPCIMDGDFFTKSN